MTGVPTFEGEKAALLKGAKRWMNTEPPVLILAPAGRDAEVAAAILAEEGVSSTIARHGRACGAGRGLLCGRHGRSASRTRTAGAGGLDCQQPPWSDFPFVLLASRGTMLTASDRALGNVRLLERPFHPPFWSMPCVALRASERQQEAEAYLHERAGRRARRC